VLAGCLLIGYAVYVTSSATPLWGLILVGITAEAIAKTGDKNEQEEEDKKSSG